jgi:hypothetical protein
MVLPLRASSTSPTGASEMLGRMMLSGVARRCQDPKLVHLGVEFQESFYRMEIP